MPTRPAPAGWVQVHLVIAIPDHFRNPGISGLKARNPGIPGLIPGLEFQLNVGITSQFIQASEFKDI